MYAGFLDMDDIEESDEEGEIVYDVTNIGKHFH